MTREKGNFTMARMGRVGFIFDCRDCKEKIRLTLYFGLKKIWKLHQRHLAKVISTPETQGECSVSL
jgi:hypothetical protein